MKPLFLPVSALLLLCGSADLCTSVEYAFGINCPFMTKADFVEKGETLKGDCNYGA